MVTPTHTPTPRHVAVWVRWITGAIVAYSAWMIGWISGTSTWLDTLLPVPWSVAMWLTVWMVIAATALIATVTGCDRPTRLTLGALLAAEVAAIATAIAVPVPARTQFLEISEAGLLIVVCGAMLSSSLRPIPTPPSPPDPVER